MPALTIPPELMDYLRDVEPDGKPYLTPATLRLILRWYLQEENPLRPVVIDVIKSFFPGATAENQQVDDADKSGGSRGKDGGKIEERREDAGRKITAEIEPSEKPGGKSRTGEGSRRRRRS